MGLTDIGIVLTYVICHLTPVSVCRRKRERGFLELDTCFPFPHDTVLGIRVGLIERFDHSWGWNGLMILSSDNEPVLQMHHTLLLSRAQSSALVLMRVSWQKHSLACGGGSVSPVGTQLRAAQYCNILPKIIERWCLRTWGAVDSPVTETQISYKILQLVY